MEQENTIVLKPEDYQDYHKLARKIFRGEDDKGGRPTKAEKEFKEYLKDLYQYRLAKDSGLFDTFIGNLQEPKRTERQRAADSKGSGDGLLRDLLKGDFNRIIEVGEFGAEDAIRNAIKYGLPVVGSLGAIWMAETKIKDFPQVLHSIYSILLAMLRLFDVLANFIGDGLGGLTKAISDPLSVLSPDLREASGFMAGLGCTTLAAMIFKLNQEGKPVPAEALEFYKKKDCAKTVGKTIEELLAGGF